MTWSKRGFFNLGQGYECQQEATTTKRSVKLTEGKLQCMKLNQELCSGTLSATTVTEKETYLKIKFLPFAAEFNFCHFLQCF